VQSGGHAGGLGASRVAVNKNMDKLANGIGGVAASLEDANLVRDRGAAQLVDTQVQVDKGGELDGGKVVAVRVDDEANVGRGWGVEGAVGDEIGVDDGIKEQVVDAVVDVGVLVVVAPAGAVVEGEGVVAAAAGLEGVHGGGVVVVAVVDVVV
jgi:hypothetical protein